MPLRADRLPATFASTLDLDQGGMMKHRPVLTMHDVKILAAGSEAEALRQSWAVTIAIVDEGGHLLHLQRLDGAPPISAAIAPAKARSAARGRRESKVYEDVINQGWFAFLSAPELQGMLEGGVPIMADGECVGAIGVSGVKSSDDVRIAQAGIAALLGWSLAKKSLAGPARPGGSAAWLARMGPAAAGYRLPYVEVGAAARYFVKMSLPRRVARNS